MQVQKPIGDDAAGMLKTGEIMVKEGLIRPDDIDTVISIQEKTRDSVSFEKKRLFGMILCDLNLITPMDNYFVLHKYKKLISVPSELVARRLLPKDRVAEILKESRDQGLPFISSLITRKAVPAPAMQTLLFDLFHIPFRSISDFIFKEGDRPLLINVLDRATALEQKILPLIIKNNTLLFGITDPENILFIRQLSENYPQYRFKVMFIPFSGFNWFYKIVYQAPSSMPARKKPEDPPLPSDYKISIQNPDKERAGIVSLYQRYERLRVLAKHPARGGREDLFVEFITLSHRDLAATYQSRSICFCLKQNGEGVQLVAMPEA